MNELPKDPMMLLSVVNMKLRDAYPTLDALCDDMHVDQAQIRGQLAEAGFTYDEAHNRFW